MDSQIEQKVLETADRFFDQKEYASALTLYKKAFLLANDSLEARTGIVITLVHMGKYSEALPLLRELLVFMPESEQLRLILAESLGKSGYPEEAEECLQQLVDISPTSVEGQLRLGKIYLDQERYKEANNCFTNALQHHPDNVDALAYMGTMLIKFCQFDDAKTLLAKAHAIAPENVLVLNNLGRAYKMTGEHNDALAWFRRALELEPDNTTIIGNYLFALNYCHGLDPGYIASEHLRLAPDYLPKNSVVCAAFTASSPTERVRIGYVSGDYYSHSVSYFIEPILQHHDYNKFELFCYSLGSTQDATTARIKAMPCHWRDMRGMPPEALAEQIRGDRIDILVDLSGHTADNRLGAFAMRSAPVQVCWVGYPNTTGLSAMDYYLTDNICDPPGMTDHLYSENLWRLPRVFCCYLPPVEFPAISDPPFKDKGFITFGSFNNFAKATPQQLEIWARILREVPDSRLYLKSMALGDPSVKKEVLARFDAEGIAPERINMRVVTKTALEHLQEYSRVDIALDTFPYNGTTTTCEALWMGTPVITLAGVTHVSRVGASLLHHVGCDDLVAFSGEEYVKCAVSLAMDKGRLNEIRNSMRGIMAHSALMDLLGVTREVEDAYLAMLNKDSLNRGVK